MKRLKHSFNTFNTSLRSRHWLLIAARQKMQHLQNTALPLLECCNFEPLPILESLNLEPLPMSQWHIARGNEMLQFGAIASSRVPQSGAIAHVSMA